MLDCIVLLNGGIQAVVPGVDHFAEVVMEERYDGELYRDLIGSDVMGRASTSPTVTVTTIGGSPPTVDVEVTNVPDPHFEEDDRFNHEPQRDVVKKVHYTTFYADAGSTEIINKFPTALVRGVISNPAIANTKASYSYVQ